MISDPYSVLGISRDATPEEVKKAYRKKAKEYHPDLHPDDPQATEKMNEINIAYDMICNPDKYKKQEQRSSGYGGGPYGSTYQNRSYENSGQNQSYGNYYEFNFDDLFGFGQRSQQIHKPSREPEDSEQIKQAVDFIYMGKYDYAHQILSGVVSGRRDARWHYLYALANQGLGNQILAFEEIQKAVSMEPDNLLYRQIYNEMNQTSHVYQSASQGFHQYADGMQKMCTAMCAIYFCCMCC